MKKLFKNYAIWLTTLSLVGVVASFWQTVEKMHILKNPEAIPSCNLNPIVDCGTVLNNNLSSLFGVPNSLIGVVMFSILFAIGLALLSGVKANKRLKQITFALATIMLLFSAWFFTVSLYSIGKICVFCIFIWSAVIPMFYLTVREYADVFKMKKGICTKVKKLIDEYPDRFIVVSYLIVFLLFLYRFRDYYL